MNLQNEFIISTAEQSDCSINLRPQKKKRTCIPRILDGTFYCIESNINGKITAKCCECSELKKGDISSTGNFLNHYRAKHSTLQLQLEQHLKSNNLPQTENTSFHVSKEQVKNKKILLRNSYSKCTNLKHLMDIVEKIFFV